MTNQRRAREARRERDSCTDELALHARRQTESEFETRSESEARRLFIYKTIRQVAVMDIEKFIEYVKKYPILYNTRHKDFKNALKKAEMWERIAGEMNESSVVLRTKWKGLKDGYTKYKKQVKGNTGSAKTYVNWCWGPHLLFLDNFIKQRESTSNISTVSQETSTSSIPSPSQPTPTLPLKLQQNDETSQVDNNILEQISPTLATPSPSPFTSMSTSRTLHRTSAEPSRSRAAATKPDDDVEKILNFMRSKRLKPSDAVDDLFMSYAKTFKKNSIQTQTMLKVEMAKLFADAELREHMNENQAPVYSVITIDSDLTTEDSLDQQIQQVTATTFNAPSMVDHKIVSVQ